MKDLGMTIRLEADMNAMKFNMARFIDAELSGRAEELKAIAEKVVSEFNFEKEFRQQLNYASQDIMRKFVREKMDVAVEEFLRKTSVSLDILGKDEQKK